MGSPVGQLGVQDLILKPPALPDCEVGVLRGQRRQRRGFLLPAAERPVKRRQLTTQQADRPLVADDMMQAQIQHMVVRPQPDQTGSQQRTGGQIERLRRIRGDE